jgi:(p)ppGpp synthase/HD superfamily hydrolase
MHSAIDQAIGFAARAHDGQRRKTGNVPYIAHPFGVAMILQEMGCDETIVVAGLLHDTVEDTKVTLEEIRSIFGDEVAEIVAICTEPPKRKFNWESRKLHMINALRDAPLSAKLVSAADKYHNLGHTSYTKQTLGAAIWKHFGRDEAHQAWYYRSMFKSIIANVPEPQRYPIFGRLESLIDEIFAGIPSQPPTPR